MAPRSPGITMASILSSGTMATKTALSPSLTPTPAPTRSTLLRTVCWANLPGRTLPSRRVKPLIWENRMEAGALWKTALGHRLARPHLEQILQRRRRQLLALGLGFSLCASLSQRHHLHHRQERYRKDWFFEQVPHVENRDWLNPEAKDPANQPFGWVKTLPTGSPDPWKDWGHGRATTWTIKFNVAKAERGQATLRLALAGADGPADWRSPSMAKMSAPFSPLAPMRCVTTPRWGCGRSKI